MLLADIKWAFHSKQYKRIHVTDTILNLFSRFLKGFSMIY